MTSLRFVGDLPVWLGLLLAVVGAVLAFAYYRRESFDLPGHLRWLLPSLRALAIWMVIIILIGPVLHHRKEIGQLGNVRLLVDASQSMTVRDPQMPLPRKLLIASQQGWLPQGQFETQLSDLSDRIATVRRQSLASLKTELVSPAEVRSVRTELDESVAELKTLIDAAVVQVQRFNTEPSDLANRFQKEVIEPLQGFANETFDDGEQSNAARDRLIETVNHLQPFETAYAELFARYCENWIDAQGAAATSGIQLFDQSLRIRRIESQLLDREDGLIARLKDHHHLDLSALVGTQEVPIWSSRSDAAIPESFDELQSATSTDLASGLIVSSSAEGGDSDTAGPVGTATVLLSDGQHNKGPSPSQISSIALSQKNAVYTVGFGTRNEPTDLVLLSCEYPDTVYKTERIRGSLLIKDRMPEGRPFVVQVRDGETVVWQQELQSLNIAQRRVDFELAVEPLVDAAAERFDTDVKHNSMPLELTAAIVPVDGETETDNNTQTIRFAAITQRQKVLLIDGRSRWETRYLRNLFERDSGWDIQSVILESESGKPRLPRGSGEESFPDSKQSLFEFDLIVYGDAAASAFNPTQTAWIRDFVDQRGGGLIFIDGPHGELSRLDREGLGVLLPVTWSPKDQPQAVDRLQLSEIGRDSPALTLAGTGSANEEFWRQVPAPHQIALVQPLAGAEVLAEAVIGTAVHPAIVTHSFGGGRVLYFAFDETWRWRYRVADQFHQRFWNQVARWVMPRPYAVRDQFLALDSGPPRYQAGQTAVLRAQLQGPDGNRVSDATVDALLWKDGRIVSTVNLQPEGNLPGSYRGETSALDPGEFEVTIRASGFSESAFQAKTQFVVAPPANNEMEQVACNEGLLIDMATAGGGAYLREEEVSRIVDLLAPLSSGRVVQSETLLWQSWPWFLCIVGLLSVEWLLRKRNGLL